MFQSTEYPNQATILAKETMLNFNLRAAGISRFEYDFNLWNKLRQMEEYTTHTEFNLFVKMLEQKLFRDCYEPIEE